MEQLCKKLSRVIYLLRKLRNCVTADMLITAYYAFFHSHIRYGITLWGNSSSAQTAFTWQRKALRAIKNVSDRESCFPIFKELRIMTLPNLYIYCCLVDVKESLNKFPTRRDTHNYFTRKNHQIDLVSVRLEKTRSSHVYMKFKLFNKLPINARDLPLKIFKNILEMWLKENVFYSVDDFLACDISTLRM